MKFKSSEILKISRDFFFDIALPILQNNLPVIVNESACGFFGYGSECLGMDDEHSQDHHFGLRINMLTPENLIKGKKDEILNKFSEELPATYQGFSLRSGHVAGVGITPESLEGFLSRTIGITSTPKTSVDWLKIPEEDIIHVSNGEVWHDPKIQF